MKPDSAERRSVLQGVIAGACVGLTPTPLFATPQRMRDAIVGVFDQVLINEDRVRLKIPQIAENGASVQMTVNVEKPTNGNAHLVSIHVFAEKNPLPDVARFFFSSDRVHGPLTTRIRLADSQTIVAIATMSDGSLWSGSAKVVVTLAACLDAI